VYHQSLWNHCKKCKTTEQWKRRSVSDYEMAIIRSRNDKDRWYLAIVQLDYNWRLFLYQWITYELCFLFSGVIKKIAFIPQSMEALSLLLNLFMVSPFFTYLFYDQRFLSVSVIYFITTAIQNSPLLKDYQNQIRRNVWIARSFGRLSRPHYRNRCLLPSGN
jgi:hypothetical protein